MCFLDQAESYQADRLRGLFAKISYHFRGPYGEKGALHKISLNQSGIFVPIRQREKLKSQELRRLGCFPLRRWNQKSQSPKSGRPVGFPGSSVGRFPRGSRGRGPGGCGRQVSLAAGSLDSCAVVAASQAPPQENPPVSAPAGQAPRSAHRPSNYLLFWKSDLSILFHCVPLMDVSLPLSSRGWNLFWLVPWKELWIWRKKKVILRFEKEHCRISA
ncbi:uncharacterized protein LOC130831450 [Hippopotamus amphibius kiboko]|uniref:uncharacterized protein LOC130831450 n=1 Tax=Hippopotamus amphibius kiboko TaxID=575201 RepID=UPI002591F681|nr:uncharacterized protein LOC130831450 [Hippopotamus amphibius kiboko]